ncbi:glycosyltransferase [Actinoplanes sp. TFC3]|uniref:glycosyltransferase n=1 Tax=Actinoplanes sp. TFC3 TaxID=1710355 RepID=UPI0008318FFA|nr:glycosyltransferase [Actinoplanes sp. TFC3]
MTDLHLTAVLIVRDEAAMLPDCLESLRGVVDEVQVHDTGSTDGTAEVAERFGAVVTRGDWADDFAAARNAAAGASSGGWVLALDADHRVLADRSALRELLASTDADALLVDVHDEHHSGPYRQFETRLYRPDAAAWQGRVHEQLVRPDGSVPARETVPGEMLWMRHLGHATYQDRIRRAERNLALTQVTLEELKRQGGDATRKPIAETLLALGRDFAAAEQRQSAVDTFEALRELFPLTPEWVQATDGLARLVLASGYDKLCLVLVEQLRDAGADPAYCNWLAAQALAQLGDPYEAAALLDGVDEVVDTAGRRRDPAVLREITALVQRLQTLTPLRN